MTLSATAALLAATGSMLAAGGSPKVVLTAPGHTPTIGTHWDYRVTVTAAGKPSPATISEQIVDPIGGVHPVQFGTSTKNITNWKITGSFHDFIVWPASSRGVPLTLRVTVRVGSLKRVADYSVVPRA